MKAPPPSADMITILSWGGIGDTLRNIGLVPHQYLFQKFGIRCRVVRRPQQPGERDCPPVPIFQELVERSPTLLWTGAMDNPPRHQRIGNRAVREIVKLLHHNTPQYFPFNFQLTEPECAMLPARPPGFQIGIQTHLSGVPSKEWGIANWQTYLRILLAESPGIFIVLIDHEERVGELCFDPRISSTRGLNIAQSIAVAEQVNLMVSIDSWSKYVAASRKIPQLVIVPSQSEYHNPEGLAREWFEGIFNQPSNTLIGLTGTLQHPRTTLDRIEDLSPQSLAHQTLPLIQKYRHAP
ncbi:MAG: hypothetical protein WCD79_15080 [Chthoniobacteraceae bacterium]